MLKKILFPNQQPNEKILTILRRHWTIALIIAIKYIIFLLFPILAMILLSSFFPTNINNILLGTFSHPILIMILSLFYLFVWIFFFHAWIDYYLDVWIVTDKRIVNIEQNGLFSRTISELKLFRVQDVKAEVHGIIPTFFHYGEVTVQSAGNETFAIFKQVPRPYETSREISKLVEHDKKNHPEISSENIINQANPNKDETISV